VGAGGFVVVHSAYGKIDETGVGGSRGTRFRGDVHHLS
jgi:hypothetical protein